MEPYTDYLNKSTEIVRGGQVVMEFKPNFHVGAFSIGQGTRLKFSTPVLVPFQRFFTEMFGKGYDAYAQKAIEEGHENVDEFLVAHYALKEQQLIPEDPRSAVLRVYTPWIMDRPMQYAGKFIVDNEPKMPGLYDVRPSHGIRPEQIGQQWATPIVEYVDVTGYVLFDPNISDHIDASYSPWVGSQLLNAMFFGNRQGPFTIFPALTDTLVGVCIDYPTQRRMHHARTALSS
jgi:hypothetical protein